MNSYLALVLFLASCARTKASRMEVIDRSSRKSLEKTQPQNKKLIRPYKSPGPKWMPDRIVGGEEAEVGRYPYMVTLLKDDYPFCGGTLVDPDWVLSAAHCAGYATHILIGHHEQDNIPDSAELIEVEFEIPHPLFNDYFTFENDVMMIKLKTPSSFDIVTFAESGSELEGGADVTVIGWGATSFQGSVSNELREVEVQIVEGSECEAAYSSLEGSDVTNDMICAAAPGKDSCQGDSGGPLLIKGADASADVQVGVVSWGFECANEDFPGVYASVSVQTDFIEYAIANGTKPDDDVDDIDSEPHCEFPNDGFDYEGSGCSVDDPCFIGDEYCDSIGDYNTESCNYDGGDCEFSEVGWFAWIYSVFIGLIFYFPCFP